LASCYRNSLQLTKDSELKSTAFPSISTGVYGYPFAEACKIAITEIQSFMNEYDNHIKVTLVTHSQKDFDIYSSIYDDFKE
jgi:O-acetyl-ADP-ribose deacetylase (regulator of RNase III)